MIEITSNIKEVSARLYRRLLNISTPENLDKLSREIGITLAGEMRERIHERGEDSSGAQIGTYTPAYLRTRQQNYGRTADPKVILSLTRQMENDFTTGINNPDPTKTPDGYGIGFKNDDDFKKSQWAEENYKKPIYKTTTTEKQFAHTIAEDFVNRQIKNI